MKKLLLFGVFLLFPSLVTAAGHVELRVAPDDVNLGGYYPSDTITIQIYATGFYEYYPYDTVGVVNIASITTDNGGTASEPNLHDALEYGLDLNAGTIVNSGGILIKNIVGHRELGSPGVYPFPAVLWECEFHIPDLPYSSIITIRLNRLVLTNAGDFTIDPPYTVSGPLEIQVVSACCPGDTDNDGDIDFDDFTEILELLISANYLRTGGIGEPNYLIYDGCVTTGFLWDNCLDIIDDEKIDLADFYKIMGDLGYANWIRTGGIGDPNYNIWPGHPLVGFLWPCN